VKPQRAKKSATPGASKKKPASRRAAKAPQSPGPQRTRSDPVLSLLRKGGGPDGPQPGDVPSVYDPVKAVQPSELSGAAAAQGGDSKKKSRGAQAAQKKAAEPGEAPSGADLSKLLQLAREANGKLKAEGSMWAASDVEIDIALWAIEELGTESSVRVKPDVVLFAVALVYAAPRVYTLLSNQRAAAKHKSPSVSGVPKYGEPTHSKQVGLP